MGNESSHSGATPARRNSQLFRRDFLVGATGGIAAGLIGTRAATAVASPDMSARVLFGAKQVSYSQGGEDVIIAHLFQAITRNESPTYLDIGAYEPITSNNTYLLYRNGGHGILIEPNPDLTGKLRRTRPGDTVLAVGIGISDDPSADYYLMSDAELHTFDKEQAERLQREGVSPIQGVLKMPLININSVIADHFGGVCPDLISIDIEGLDYAVLKTLDFAKYRPKIICAETLITNTERHNPETVALLTGLGYQIRGMTYANTIFVDTKVYRK